MDTLCEGFDVEVPSHGVTQQSDFYNDLWMPISFCGAKNIHSKKTN